jgi:anti-sigma B factor antagonist
VTVLQHDHAVVMVHVAGELDMPSAASLQSHLDQVLATQTERLIIDLSQVSFLGSTGLTVLANTKTAATKQGTRLQLRSVSSAAARPLQITELVYLFDILPT